MNSLKNRLKDFKLSGICNSLEERLSLAKQKSMGYLEFLELLVEDEYNTRKDNSYKKRFSQSKLSSYKTIEDFDFAFQPSIDKRLINDCSTCSFISEKRNIVFIGKPGTGKTHLAIAISIKALMKGFKVLFSSCSELLYTLNASKADNTYFKKLEYYLSADLLVLDELGFKKIPSYSANDFFEIISRRYEKGSLIITTKETAD
ncbi:IstB domain-containing protein ATP-binding protein [Candidatus Omnitrophus magneticus]|uniref:IstB domain-containing protein ATP-binding protein n=1 Tax=Candidatus Omnitrophus magneticus TaxID=1609969 RepID=A0A0F0CWS6_9BACT|nr:IstB domain-containing protein ATP-binding protein [Candidatus Omnitrophus magneticus]